MQQILFSCRALNASGAEVHVSINAGSKEEALEILKAQQLYPKHVEVLDDLRFEVGQNGQKKADQKKKGAKKTLSFGGLFAEKSVSQKNLTVFTRQLATLLEAGLPLVRSLSMLYEQQKVGLFKNIIGQLRDSIQSGETFSDALTHHPKVFNRLFVKMVKAGELGGVLDTVLDRLADFMEKGQKLKGKIKSALMYPGIVLFIAISIVSGLLVFIVPKFEKIFSDMLAGKPLPFLTQIIIDASNLIINNFLLILLGLGGGIPLAIHYLRKPVVIRVVDKWLYWMPLFGELVRMGAMSQFFRTLGTLIMSGVPILQALTNAKETTGNAVIGNAITLVHNSVKGGETIRTAMHRSGAFSVMAVGMVEVGEETGSLPKMLLKVADVYDDEVDNAVGGLTSMIEPIMIVFLALMIGTIVVALFLPLIGLVSGMQEDIQ